MPTDARKAANAELESLLADVLEPRACLQIYRQADGGRITLTLNRAVKSGQPKIPQRKTESDGSDVVDWIASLKTKVENPTP